MTNKHSIKTIKNPHGKVAFVLRTNSLYSQSYNITIFYKGNVESHKENLSLSQFDEVVNLFYKV